MLVIDLHTLQAVNLLHLVNDITSQLGFTHQAQDIVGVERAVRDHFTLFHFLTFEHVELAPLGNQLFVGVTTVIRGNHQANLAFGFLAEGHGTGLLGQDGSLFRVPCLEQVGNPGQTTGDVTGLGGFLRNPRNHVTHGDAGTILETTQRTTRQQILGRHVSVGHQYRLALAINHTHYRAHVLAGGGTVLGTQHFDVGQTGQFVGLVVYGDTFFHITELHLAFHFRDDRVGMGIPGGNHLTAINLITFAHGHSRTIGQLVTLTLTAQLIRYRQVGGTGNDHQTVLVLYMLGVMETHLAAVLDLDAGHRRRPAGRTTDVEGTHGQLGTRLTDGLGGNNAHRFTHIDLMATGQVTAITGGTHTPAGGTGDRRAHQHFIHTHGFQLVDPYLIQQGAGFRQDFVLLQRVHHIPGHHTTQNTLTQTFHHVTAFNQRRHQQAFLSTTVILGDDQILSHVHQTAGQVTGVRRLQGGIGQTFTGTVSGDEVLEYVQALTEVTGDRRFDDGTIRLRHQTTHTGQLTNLCRGAPRTGIGHHKDRVEGTLLFVLAVTVFHHFDAQVFHHCLGDLVVGTGPDIHHLVITLTTGYQTGSKLLLDLANLVFGRVDHGVLGIRDHHVFHTNGGTGQGGFAEAQVHQLVGKDTGFFGTQNPVAGVQQLGNRLLGHVLVDHGEAQTGGHDIPQLTATRSGISDKGTLFNATFQITHHFMNTHFHPGMQINLLVGQGTHHFFGVGKNLAFTLGVYLFAADVVQTKYHVLSRADDGLTIGRRQDVVGGHHQRAGFQLGFQGQRQMHRHLVTIEVRVEGRTHQRMQLDRLTFNQYRLERLDTQTVKGRRPVQHDRVLANHFRQDIPDLGSFALDHFLGRLDGGRQTTGFQLGKDERLEQFQRHLLGQAGLVQLERRPHHDHGTTGVVHPLTQQVLTETTLLTLDHVSQGFQRALVGTGDGTATTAVIQQRIHRFLQHALFVAHDDVRGAQVQQTLETVVPVDHPTVQIVQVGGGKTTTVQRYQRTQIRRQHRQHGENHPLRLVTGILEGFHQLQTLGQLLQLGVGVGGFHFFAQDLDLFDQVQLHEQLLYGLGTHLGFEFVTELFQGIEVLFVSQQLTTLKGGHARLSHHKGLEVQHPLDITQGHVQHQTDTGR